MKNSFFQFKQFRINQDKTAMKVCTDSCILGAWANVETAKTILDIGTGTGLLSLMAAQRSEAKITAVEIDANAAAQAEANFANSPWENRITLVIKPLQEFGKTNRQKFDVIICNPPFFQASLQSPDAAKTIAKHTSGLPFADLLTFALHNLETTGSFYVLLPPAEAEIFRRMALAENLFVNATLEIFTQPNGKYLRTINQYQFSPKTPQTHTLYIRNPDQSYTAQFEALLREYYLIF